MSRNAQSGAREASQDVLSYLKFAGYEQTRDQLVRLHQRRLIDQPFHGLSGWRGLQTTHPAGTAERMLRIAQLKSGSKQLDELAWRLWWEGSTVEADLVRDYLVKMASRWDDRLTEIRRSAVESASKEVQEGERDILDEVFFQHLKVAPALASMRKGLGKDSDLYLEFAGLLIDLLRGDFSVLGEPEVALFDVSLDEKSVTSSNGESGRQSGRAAAYAMQSAASLPYSRMVESLDDEQLESARLVALLFSRIIASIGEIMHDGYATTGRRRDTVGRNLVALSESPEEQVLSLLLTSSFLKDERIRSNLPDFEVVIIHSPAISYLDYLRIRYLAKEIPAMDNWASPQRIRDAFESLEGAERWRASFEEFRLGHLQEIEEAMARRPELFGLGPPDVEEDPDHADENGKTKKKK